MVNHPHFRYNIQYYLNIVHEIKKVKNKLLTKKYYRQSTDYKPLRSLKNAFISSPHSASITPVTTSVLGCSLPPMAV